MRRAAPFGAVVLATTVILAGCAGSSSPSTAQAPTRLATASALATPATLSPSVSPTSQAAVELSALRMVTAAKGWALAVGRGADAFPGSGTRVVRTMDGGRHWVAAGLPDGLDPVAADFHDASHAWVVELFIDSSTASHQTVTVASTSDAGAHWTTTPAFGVDGAATHVQFLDSAHGWVFATPSAGGVIGAQDTTLYRTVDGGMHWAAMKPPSQVRPGSSVRAALPEECHGGGTIGPPSFVDARTGWIGAFCTRVFFYVTHDGGINWAPQALPPFPGPAYADATVPPLYDVNPAQVIAVRDAVVVVHRGFTTGANALQDAAIYATRDAGQSWVAIRLPAPELSIVFSDTQHGWAVTAGAGGNTEVRSLYSSVDGGRTWRLVSGPHDYFSYELSFVDPHIGFLVSSIAPEHRGALWETTDGGVTWVAVPTMFG